MDVLAIFVKQPRPGQVKTRLAATVGQDRAAELYAAFTADLVARFRTLGDRRLLAHAPDEEVSRAHFDGVGGGDFDLWPQPEAVLGERLTACFGEALDGGAERVVVIGSDSPLLPADFVERAFGELDAHDVVLGPATDGGYYLVGLRRESDERLRRRLFEEIDWSGPRVLGQTVERITELEASLALLPPWYDVDTGEDLGMLRGHVAALRAAGAPVDLAALEPLLRTDEVKV